jgi:hypothetical protein
VRRSDPRDPFAGPRRYVDANRVLVRHDVRRVLSRWGGYPVRVQRVRRSAEDTAA